MSEYNPKNIKVGDLVAVVRRTSHAPTNIGMVIEIDDKRGMAMLDDGDDYAMHYDGPCGRDAYVIPWSDDVAAIMLKANKADVARKRISGCSPQNMNDDQAIAVADFIASVRK